MPTLVRGVGSAGLYALYGAALLSLGAGLSGCNLVAGALLAGGDGGGREAVVAALGTTGEGPRELRLTLRPGVSLLQAAERAPHAVSMLRGAARRLGELPVLDGRYLQTVSSGLLDEGLLLPGPLGALEIRTIAPEAPALAAAPGGAAPTAEPAARCAGARSLAQLVGAYRAGTRLLLLQTDGQFLLSEVAKGRGAHRATQVGRYQIHCQDVELVAEGAAPVRLTPLAQDGLMEQHGSVFFPMTALSHGDVP